MPYNIELFKQINEIISTQPDRHDQGTWESQSSACGTTRCVAGWAVHLTVKADLFTLDDDGYATTSPEVRALAAQQNRGGISKSRSIPRIARELLGLTADEATVLFFYADEEEAREVVGMIAAGQVGRAALWFAEHEQEAE